jgi:DNA polymerase-1
VRVCVTAPDAGRPGQLQPVDDAGAPTGPGTTVAADDDLAREVARLEAERTPRWVWADAATCYPRLLTRGVRLARCHDVALTEALLLGHEGRWGEPRSLAAAWARLNGAPVPDDLPTPSTDDLAAHGPPLALFDADDLAVPGPPLVGGVDEPTALLAVHADQLRRIAAAREVSGGFVLLVAAESAAGLAAVEMSAAGLPWRPDVHDAVLTQSLGPRPPRGGRPPVLQALAEEIAEAFGEPRLNPDSQPELMRALRRAGFPVTSTRRHELRRLDHPAVPALLRYKELARLHAANGWTWLEQWVRGGRFRPAYLPGGVVSGRWATRGGGALQIPRAVRAAVVAEPGTVLVVADAGQLEPRVLAALSADPGLVAAAAQGDLYADIAVRALGRPEARDEAKVALLSAMYGGGAGSAALTALRRRFPAALQLLEDAAKAGEEGRTVRSVLGRTCPPARNGWLNGLPAEAAAARARARGRFTRNFVVQASAADWAGVLLARLRTRLAALEGRRPTEVDGTGARPSAGDDPGAGPNGVDDARARPFEAGTAPGPRPAPPGPRLVFFQHDEVLVEAPARLADAVIAAVAAAGDDATRLVLGDCGVRVPLKASVVQCYAAKEGGAT